MSTRPIGFLCAAMALAGAGCDDAFSPKGPIAEEPILYCVLQVRPTQEYYAVTATLARVYDVEGFNPHTNTEDPSLKGASISLLSGSRFYTLDETLLPRPPGSPYSGSWHVYRSGGVYVRTQDTLRLQGRLQVGRELSAVTAVPRYKPVSSFPLYRQGVTTLLPSLYFGSAWIIGWDDNFHEDHLFFPKLQLIYEISTPTGVVRQARDVPLRYVLRGEEEIPLYPQATSSRKLAFDFAAMDRTMASISEGDPQKDRYRPIEFAFELIELDFALSRYYSSINGSLDRLSIRLDESVFTNITNGHGVFGTSMVNSWGFSLNEEYAATFGYTTGLTGATPPPVPIPGGRGLSVSEITSRSPSD